MARKIPLTLAQTRELAIRVAERRAKKHAKRTVTREARATGTAPILEGWAKNIQKGQYGQDIFDGKVHAKWPSMFKKHLGVLETHIKSLDRVMQAMRSEMSRMVGEDKKQFELSEKSRWRTICLMLDQSREALVAARFASKSIIPPSWQREKNGLGVKGLTYEPLLPRLREKARAEGIVWNEDRSDLSWGRNTNNKSKSAGSDSASVSSSSHGSDGEDTGMSDAEAESTGADSNPFFVIDTKPTPVNFNGGTHKKSKEGKKSKENDRDKDAIVSDPPAATDATTPASVKKNKKRSKDDDTDELHLTKRSKDASTTISQEPTNVDFAAVEAQLHAEVKAGLKAKEERVKLTRKEKKRKRNSDGIQGIVESFKKKQRLEDRQMAKAQEAATSDKPVEKKRKGDHESDDGNSKRPRAEDGH